MNDDTISNYEASPKSLGIRENNRVEAALADEKCLVNPNQASGR